MAPDRTSRTLAVVLLLLLAAHWLLFAAYVKREIAWAYAPHFDQSSGLFIAYRTWDNAGRLGLPAALADALRRSPPNGAAIHNEAVLLFLLTGPSRLAALAVNWLHFALAQGALVWALWVTSRRWELPVLGLGLLLSAQAPYYWAGGIADFRPDFAAFCLYGTFLAVVWRSGVFQRPGWSIAAGAVAALCVVSRSLTAVYFGGVLGLSLACLTVLWWRQRDAVRRQDLRRRLTGGALCATCVFLVALPALVLQARSLWAYYVVGHVTGKENAIRAAFAGPTLSERLLFYPRSALFDHGGTLFLCLALGCLAVLGAVKRLARGPAGVGSSPPPPRGAGWFMALALALPLTVLTVNVSKSPIVGGLLVMPLLWLVLAWTSRLAAGSPPAVLRVLAVCTLTAGVGGQVARLTGPAPAIRPVEAVRDAMRLHDDIVRWSAAHAWPSPVLVSDRLRDDVYAIRVSAYERHGRLLALEQPAATIFRPEEGAVMQALRRSQLVILTRPQPGPAVAYSYPYDAGMAELYPRLLAYCKRNLVRVGTYRVPDEVMLFAREDEAPAQTASPPSPAGTP